MKPERHTITAPVYETGLPPCRRLDLELSDYQAVRLRLLLDGLQLDGASLRSGRAVSSPAAAVRWMLEQITVETRKHGIG